MRLDRSINHENLELHFSRTIHEDNKIVCENDESNNDEDNDYGDWDGCRMGRRQHRRLPSFQKAAAAQASKAAPTTFAASLIR